MGFLLLSLNSEYDYEGNKNYNTIRNILMGGDGADKLSRFTGVANLNYISTPGYFEFDTIQINPSGYRGKDLPRKKKENTTRMLFLGGSTTYGMALVDGKSAFPAVCGGMLEKHIERQGSEIDVEVINGGLLWATSFELLAHYKHKYRFYDPDMVIIHTGGNDAMAYGNLEAYQPDYSHWRKPMESIKPLPIPARWMMHSRLFSFFVVHLFFSEMDKTMFVHYDGKSSTPWFNYEKEDLPAPPINSYYRNMEGLLEVLTKDSVRVYLMPFVLNPDFPKDQLATNYEHGIILHNEMLKQLAAKYQAEYIEVPIGEFDKSNWIDDCHLNEEGHQIKAEILSRGMLDRLAPSS